MDTNAVIDFLGGVLPTATVELIVGRQPIVSVVTQIESLGWNGASQTQLIPVLSFLNQSLILPLSDTVVAATIQLRHQKKMKLGDAIIAATALTHKLPLLTRNIADFKNIEGLQLLNPHEL